MNKIKCPECGSKKHKTLTGMCVGNPVGKRCSMYLVKKCLKCRMSFVVETIKNKGKKTTKVLKSEVKYDVDGAE